MTDNSYHVATFYTFVPLPDVEEWQLRLRRACTEHSIKGTILLAEEGLNATISGSSHGVQAIIDLLASDERFAEMAIKTSTYTRRPFKRMKVRVKPEIVTFGVPDVDPLSRVGTYVKPSAWNDLLEDPDVTVVDTRNDFEVELGTFANAVNPNTKSFRDFATYVDDQLSPEANPKVALFCTGGIRCEKATSYLLDRGFTDVYHLDGGILNYLANVDEDQSQWQGDCFVFDERVAVTHGVEASEHPRCQSCGAPFSHDDSLSRDYGRGVCCDHCLHG